MGSLVYGVGEEVTVVGKLRMKQLALSFLFSAFSGGLDTIMVFFHALDSRGWYPLLDDRYQRVGRWAGSYCLARWERFRVWFSHDRFFTPARVVEVVWFQGMGRAYVLVEIIPFTRLFEVMLELWLKSWFRFFVVHLSHPARKKIGLRFI